MNPEKKIIGIGGISCSGKSFLAKQLCSNIRHDGKSAIVHHIDDFVFPEHKIPKIQDHIDWERPDSMDFGKFKTAISESSKKYDFVLAEGLMVFWNPDIFKMFDIDGILQKITHSHPPI